MLVLFTFSQKATNNSESLYLSEFVPKKKQGLFVVSFTGPSAYLGELFDKLLGIKCLSSSRERQMQAGINSIE